MTGNFASVKVENGQVHVREECGIGGVIEWSFPVDPVTQPPQLPEMLYSYTSKFLHLCIETCGFIQDEEAATDVILFMKEGTTLFDNNSPFFGKYRSITPVEIGIRNEGSDEVELLVTAPQMGTLKWNKIPEAVRALDNNGCTTVLSVAGEFFGTLCQHVARAGENTPMWVELMVELKRIGPIFHQLRSSFIRPNGLGVTVIYFGSAAANEH